MKLGRVEGVQVGVAPALGVEFPACPGKKTHLAGVEAAGERRASGYGVRAVVTHLNRDC
jgi:hypothetical protein